MYCLHVSDIIYLKDYYVWQKYYGGLGMVMYCDICWAKIENGDKVKECPECLFPFVNVDKSSPIKEYKSKVPHGGVIKKISTDESFMNALVKLHDEDPIEY